jgi:hypothetical protein
MFIATDAPRALAPSGAKCYVIHIPLLTELENPINLRAINISLLTELTALTV